MNNELSKLIDMKKSEEELKQIILLSKITF